LNFGGVGVWGDTADGYGYVGVVGTADKVSAAIFESNSNFGFPTIFAENLGIGPSFEADDNGGSCYIFGGSLTCTGTRNAAVPIDGGNRWVVMSAIESPQNWFEDFGSAQLVNGVAVVRLDPEFTQTVNGEIDYKVFPVPNGDCKGLYVTHKTANSFEVRELGGGTSSVSFDYRVTALRRKYEDVRFADSTEHWKQLEASAERQRAARAAGSSHTRAGHVPVKPPTPVIPHQFFQRP
jgi:hypothetical protein